MKAYIMTLEQPSIDGLEAFVVALLRHGNVNMLSQRFNVWIGK
jgi:hypothetical protein